MLKWKGMDGGRREKERVKSGKREMEREVQTPLFKKKKGH
jgi:hypothetical protein